MSSRIREQDVLNEMRHNSEYKKFINYNDTIILTLDNPNIEKFDFISSRLAYRFIDEKIKFSEIINYFITTPLLGNASIQTRRDMGYSVIVSLRNGTNISETRMDIILDFLGLDVKIVDKETGREER
jgi:hypothetical protein